jgi:hypothetical protein
MTMPDAGRAMSHGENDAVRRRILDECRAMVRHALDTGLVLPEPICTDLVMITDESVACTASVPDLSRLHGQLVQLVRPAKPNTLLLLAQEDNVHPLWRVLGPLPSVRRLVSAALVFGIMFMLASLSNSISVESMSKDIYSTSGWSQLVVLVFLCVLQRALHGQPEHKRRQL